MVEVFFQNIKSNLISDGSGYLIGEYGLLKNIVKNQVIDASHKEKVVDRAFLKFKNRKKKGGSSYKNNLFDCNFVYDFLFLFQDIFQSQNIDKKIKNKLAFNILLEFYKKDPLIDFVALKLIEYILNNDIDGLIKYELGLLVLTLKEKKFQCINLKNYPSLNKINNKDNLRKELGIKNSILSLSIPSQLPEGQIRHLIIQEPVPWIIPTPSSLARKRVVGYWYELINKKKIRI